MGQSQSKSPSYHPSSVGSHNYPPPNPEAAEALRPYPTSASGWIKRPRSRFIRARQNALSSVDIVSHPHHQFIPKQHRQRSAGPIRSRPEPSEYGLRPHSHPLPQSIHPEPFPPQAAEATLPSAPPSNPSLPVASSASSASQDSTDTRSIRRASVHRVSATPRHPPLLEESESIREPASVDAHRHASPPAVSESDHGHAPFPISPSLALALRSGLGSGSLRRTRDGELVFDQEQHHQTSSSPVAVDAGDLWSRPTRSPNLEGWQSDWQDLRFRPSLDNSQQASFTAADRTQVSRFSFGSSDPTTASSGTHSSTESGPKESSFYATPADSQRFSDTASEDGDSARLRNTISVLVNPPPDSSQSWPTSLLSLPSTQLLHPTASTTAGINESVHTHVSRTLWHERSIASLFSAAAASSDCDPTLFRDDRHGNGAPDISPNVPHVAPTAAHSSMHVHRATDPYQEPAQNTVVASPQLSMLHSDSAEHSSLGTREVDELRRGPEVKLLEESIDSIFDAEPVRTSRRSRTMSLMDRLRGKAGRAAEASTAEPQAQSGAPWSNTASKRTHVRSLSHSQVADVHITRRAQAQHTRSRSLQQEPSHNHAIQVPQSLVSSTSENTFGRGSTPLADRSSVANNNELRLPICNEHKVVGQLLGPAARETLDPARPTMVRSIRKQRSVRSVKSYSSSNGSLRARYRAAQPSSGGISHNRVKANSALAPTSWWKQNHLKRKGSAGIVAEAQATKQGRPGAASADPDAEDAAWVDIDPDRSASNFDKVAPAVVKDASTSTPASVKTVRGKEAGGLWIWPRRPSAARVFGFGLSRFQTAQAERVEIEASLPPRALQTEQVSTSRPMLGDPGKANSSQYPFTSLAPPAPPAPVPPLRRPRHPSQKTHTTPRQEQSGSADLNKQRNHQQGQQTQISEASPARSDTTRSSILGTVPSSMGASVAMGASSTVATTVSTALSTRAMPRIDLAQNEAGIDPAVASGPGDFAVSPAPTMSRRISETSDAGTKEILLSDRESLSTPNGTSESFIRGPIDEQHPDFHTFYPAGASFTRPIRNTLSSPLSPMTEEEVGSTPRLVGAVPDLSSPLSSVGHDGSLGWKMSPYMHHHSLTEASRSFRSVRSFRSTSEGSARRYRPLPIVPGRSRGHSLDLVNRRDPAYGADSLVSADAHSRHGSIERTASGPVDGLPVQDTQLSPLMLMSLVTAASSSTEYTHGSHEQATTGHERYGLALSRSSTVSTTSPIGGPRPFPSIHARGIDATYESAGSQFKVPYERRSTIPTSSSSEGPPLSPSAFYENKPQVPSLSARWPAGPRDSWTSADGPWSAAVVTSSSVLGAVRGMARPVMRTIDTGAHRRALSQPHDDDHRVSSAQVKAPAKDIDEDEDAELTRLEKSRSGSKIVASQSKLEREQLPDCVERAPYADTGVQASLAALRALESPGESLRTILARQRMFGEPDASVMEFLRESRILDSQSRFDDGEVLAMSGPRPRRRSAPYPRLRDSYCSSEEFSSSGRSLSGLRAEAARRRRRRNYKGTAEASSTSLVEMSGRESDYEGVRLAAARLGHNASTSKPPQIPANDRGLSASRGDASTEVLPTAPILKAWEDLAGIGEPQRDPWAGGSALDNAKLQVDGRSDIPDLAVTPPADDSQNQEHLQRPHHDRFVTALSSPNEALATNDREEQHSETAARPHSTPRYSPEPREGGRSSPRADAASRASSMSPALLLKHEHVASQIPSSTTFAGSRFAFPSSPETADSLSSERISMRSPSLPQTLAVTGRKDSAETSARVNKDNSTTRPMLAQQRQRSRSDVHASYARNSRTGSYRSRRHELGWSRYDAQLEDLLLLREKARRAGSSASYGRFDGRTASINYGDTASVREDKDYLSGSARRPRMSPTSSKRKSRSSKLGYTLPDIMAWQAGLGNNSNVLSKVA